MLEIIEMYSVQNAPVIELKQQLEEKRHQQERMEGELKLLIEKKASLLEEITSLQGMRKDEEPSCSEVLFSLYINLRISVGSVHVLQHLY